MRIATNVPQDDLRKAKAAAQAAEADGYSLLITNENKHDPFLPLAIAAVETERIELATAIAISFSRSPMAVANASWDLNEASRGRFVLGLGTQVKAHNERRFSVAWTPPAPRLREYIQSLKAIWRCWRELPNGSRKSARRTKTSSPPTAKTGTRIGTSCDRSTGTTLPAARALTGGRSMRLPSGTSPPSRRSEHRRASGGRAGTAGR